MKQDVLTYKPVADCSELTLIAEVANKNRANYWEHYFIHKYDIMGSHGYWGNPTQQALLVRALSRSSIHCLLRLVIGFVDCLGEYMYAWVYIAFLHKFQEQVSI